MLIELSIRNVALIESLTLEFGEGFSVLTGETGAGKSIIVDSLNLALGSRADRDLIRTGAERADVQALFDVSGNPAAIQLAQELGAEVDDGLVAVSRELRSNGRNVCRISGVIVPLNTLRQFTKMLLDIHGQHEHQALIDQSTHIHFLDAFGGDYSTLRGETAELYAQRSKAAADYRRATSDTAERERQIDMLEFQTGEIFAIHPKRGEEEKLEKRARYYENAEKIRNSVSEAYAIINGDGRSNGVQGLLDTAIRLLESASKVDERIEKLIAQLRDGFYAVQESGYELRDISENMLFDPMTAEKVFDRLDKIRKLERKYGATLDEVIDFGENAAARLKELKSVGAGAAGLCEKLTELDNALKEKCNELTAARKRTAQHLAEAVREQLADLGMSGTRFEVSIEPIKPTALGADRVEFLISANPGEPLKPMGAVASGGELSRIMLALKAISIDTDGVDSMVFDEIDTGVSGRMAQVVGEKLKLISRRHQVLCVTHLPQIAALGDAHFMVEKTTDGVRTDSVVRRLDEDGRIAEISRLIGDGADSETGTLHARHLLGLA